MKTDVPGPMHFTTNETVSVTMKANADLPAAVFNAVSTCLMCFHIPNTGQDIQLSAKK